MKTTITLFVEPNSLLKFLEVIRVLEGLPLENDYKFNPKKFTFTEKMISNWCWVNIPIEEYLKLKFALSKNPS